jgi:hypothetical protein
VTHNPHYYAWARLNGGLAPAPVAAAALPACAFPTLGELVAISNDPVVLEYHRYLVHIKFTVLLREQRQQNQDNADLRVLYMAGLYNKRSFGDCLLDRFIKAQMSRRRREVYEMVYAAGGDLLLTAAATASATATASLKQLLAYGDECLRKLSDQYGVDCGSLCPSVEDAGV